MPHTEAQLRAIEKYNRKAYRKVLLNINRKYHPDIIDKLESVDSINDYVLTLIYRDIGKEEYYQELKKSRE